MIKGKKMAGRMGNDQVTVRCDLFKIDAEKNLLLLRGPVPGANGGVIFIRRSKINDTTVERRKKAAESAAKAAESAKKKSGVPTKK